MQFLKIKNHIINTEKILHAETFNTDDGKFVLAINFDVAREEDSVVFIDFDTEKDCKEAFDWLFENLD